MVSRVLFSSQLTFPAKPPRETPIAPLTPPRNVLSFSFRSSVDRFAMRIVKAASFTRTVAKVGGSRDEEAISRKKLAVFVSGGGSNFKKIHEGCIGGSVQGDLVLLVTNKKDCGGAEYARSNGIAVLVFPKPKRESSDGLSPTELVDVLREYGVDFVLLAGYLKLIPAELVKAFPKRILNIHPALLPAFGGIQVQPFTLWMKSMTRGGYLLKVLSAWLLMIHQRSWLKGFFTRNTNCMWRWLLPFAKNGLNGEKMVSLSFKAKTTLMTTIRSSTE
ncbi:PREDICTED: phosphoribosylglycinamide formyltransferase, chloroplastic isoform X2 [Brassica oleracea var. oleracea]|uniref:phosphoribosylglycinamide formyltransferase, chloroplastic isoform X2 n=1 Tax=Brassica oleracea var. oleracea TaxID=109376 RepID=UPI0006A70A10|nr:PREDICTED: phosphoribosylglycinamide formyltransferase, chloroplastic isoform X2 [Brassica oleracea var. oleracea]